MLVIQLTVIYPKRNQENLHLFLVTITQFYPIPHHCTWPWKRNFRVLHIILNWKELHDLSEGLLIQILSLYVDEIFASLREQESIYVFCATLYCSWTDEHKTKWWITCYIIVKPPHHRHWNGGCFVSFVLTLYHSYASSKCDHYEFEGSIWN